MNKEEIIVRCKDVIKSAAETTLEQIPYVGVFYAAVSKVKDGAYKRRLETWQELVGQRLADLEAATFDSLGDNEDFASVLVTATELAAKSNKIKMECLANAVKYVATNKVEEEYIIVFLNCMEKYTIKHLEALLYFQQARSFWKIPNPNMLLNTTEKQPYFSQYYPEMDDDLAKAIIDDLRNDGLYSDEGMINKKLTDSETLTPHATNLGKQFIDFFGLNEMDICVEN